ncbi:DNA topoisomerase VI subunit B, partial [Candidatus Micrarchaeota archaeon CG_4_10_14_0_2_um_filter_55_9]
KTVIGEGDGSATEFDLEEQMCKASLFEVLVNGIKQKRPEEYVVKYGKRGKQNVKQVVFRQPPAEGTKIVGEWAIGHIRVTVEDNGTGLPQSKVGQALGMLLAGTKFHQQKQKRGQQGIGAAYATLFAQITTGKPTDFKTGTGNNKVYSGQVSIDVKKNVPVINGLQEAKGNYRGLKVSAEFAEVSYDRSDHGVYEYLRRTALANPHAQITLVEPDKSIVVFPRASDKIPAKPPKIKPHPLGLTTSDLIDMASVTSARKLSSFLSSDFTRISDDKANELSKLLPEIDFDKHPRKMSWVEAESIVHTFHRVKFNAPDLNTLRPIGAIQLEKSLKNLLEPEFLSVIQRKPKVFRGGIPFLVEVAVAYGGKAGAPSTSKEGEVMRFANRVPLLFDAGNCAITQAVKNVDWNRYNLKNLDEQPVSVFINFVSVHVPYTGAGKLAISAEEEIVSEIRMGLMDAARKVGYYLSGLKKAEDQEKRRKIFFKYIKEVAAALHDVTGKPKAGLEAAMRKIAESKTALKDEDEQEDEELLALEEDAEKEVEEENA